MVSNKDEDKSLMLAAASVAFLGVRRESAVILVFVRKINGQNWVVRAGNCLLIKLAPCQFATNTHDFYINQPKMFLANWAWPKNRMNPFLWLAWHLARRLI